MAGRWHQSAQFSHSITSIIFILLINLTFSVGVNSQSSPCLYTFLNGSVVDLQQAIETLQNDRFSIANESFAFFYNPCRNIEVNAKCKNVAGCFSFEQKNISTFVDFGDVKKGEFKLNELSNELYLVYTSPEQNSHLKVKLLCSDEKDAKITLDNTNGTELMNSRNFSVTLSSKCCCANMCLRTPAHPSSSLSTGSILVIILAVIIMIYFIGGMFFLHFLRVQTASK
uniref:Uncharacterized protein n=1 Tax=Strigamia maritima TaxID=126957 RepID=T1IK35_STRMM